MQSRQGENIPLSTSHSPKAAKPQDQKLQPAQNHGSRSRLPPPEASLEVTGSGLLPGLCCQPLEPLFPSPSPLQACGAL